MNKRFTSIFVLIVSGTFQCQLIAEEPKEIYALAANYYSQQKWAEATAEFQRLIEEHPSTDIASHAQFYLGETLVQQSKHQIALEVFQDFFDQNPDHAHRKLTLFRIGESNYLLGRRERAIEALQRFTVEYSSDPLLAYALPYLADLQLQAGNPRQAQSLYEQTLRDFPSTTFGDECRFGSGRALQAQNKFDEALPFYRSFIIDPTSALAAEAQLQIGVIHYQMGKWEKAITAFSPFLDQYLTSHLATEAVYWQGKAHAKLQQWQAAADTLASVESRSDVANDLIPAIRFEQALSLAHLKSWDEATVILEQIWKQWPQSAWADDGLQTQIDLLHQSANYEQAIQLAKVFFDEFNNSPLTWHVKETLGRSLYAEQRYPEAANAFRELLDDPLDDPLDNPLDNPLTETADTSIRSGHVTNWRVLLGLGEIGRGSLDDAILHLQAASESASEPSLVSGVTMALAVAHLEAGHDRQAIEFQKKYLLVAPEGADVSRCLSDLSLSLANTGNWESAHQFLQQLIDEHSEYRDLPRVAHLFAEKAFQADRYLEAKESFHYLSNQNGSPEKRVLGISGLGWTFYKLDQLDSALENFQRLINQAPRHALAAEAMLMSAKIHERVDDVAAAQASYELIIENQHDQDSLEQALFSLARLKQKQGGEDNLTQAKSLYQQLLFQIPDGSFTESALYQVAWTALDLQNEPEAIRAFQKIFDDHSDGQYWADAGFRVAQNHVKAHRVPEATSILNRLIDSSAASSIEDHVLFLQGQIAASQREWDRLSETMMQLVERYPQSDLVIQAKYWVAESHFRRDDLKQAVSMFESVAKQSHLLDEHSRSMIQLRQIQILGLQEEWDECFELATQFKDDMPHFKLIHEVDYLIGRVYASRADFEKARNAYEQVVLSSDGGRTETAAMAQWMIGETYFHQENHRRAISAYHRVETLFAYPNWQAAALLQTGKCQELQTQWNDAVNTYLLLIKKYPQTQHAVEASDRLRLARSKL